MQKRTYIKASEIGEFVYCMWCWWKTMDSEKPTTEAMISGTVKHSTLFRWVYRIEKLGEITKIVLLLGIALLVIAIALTFFLI